MKYLSLVLFFCLIFHTFKLKAEEESGFNVSFDFKKALENLLKQNYDQNNYLEIPGAELDQNHVYVDLDLLNGLKFSTGYNNFSDSGIQLTANPVKKINVHILDSEDWNLSKIVYTINVQNSNYANEFFVFVKEERFYEKTGWFSNDSTTQSSEKELTLRFDEPVEIDLNQKALFIKKGNSNLIKYALKKQE